jgi:hypothetical protein
MSNFGFLGWNAPYISKCVSSIFVYITVTIFIVRWKKDVAWSIGARVGMWSMVLCNRKVQCGYEEGLEEKRWNQTTQLVWKKRDETRLLSLCPLTQLKLWGGLLQWLTRWFKGRKFACLLQLLLYWIWDNNVSLKRYILCGILTSCMGRICELSFHT